MKECRPGSYRRGYGVGDRRGRAGGPVGSAAGEGQEAGSRCGKEESAFWELKKSAELGEMCV